MSKILSSIACNLDLNILQTALPLFASEKVQAIEWSFDTLFKVKNIPPWFVDLLKEYSEADRLIGHGVFFSLFSGLWAKEQEAWLTHLRKVSGNFNFSHITEHFGFMTGANFHEGAPISIPFTPQTLAIGQDRLKRIYEACECPVGLENLAFSYSLEEVKRHGTFLEQLVAPINGFIILDLHNFYCQAHNFEIDYKDLLDLYPLGRVREIHISGGSWEDSEFLPERKVRRDTHDDSVPEEVFKLLDLVIDYCPNLKYVVLEQMGTALTSIPSRLQFQNDFYKMDAIVANHNQTIPKSNIDSFFPKVPITLGQPLEDQKLFYQQRELAAILETANSCQEAQSRLSKSSLAQSSWKVEEWEPYMLDTVIRIAQKWKGG